MAVRKRLRGLFGLVSIQLNRNASLTRPHQELQALIRYKNFINNSYKFKQHFKYYCRNTITIIRLICLNRFRFVLHKPINKIDLIESTLIAIKMQYDNYKPITHAIQDQPSSFW